MIESTIAQFQSELSLKRLSVIDDRLRFDSYLPAFASDDGIPSAKVAHDRERNLSPEGKRGVDLAPKPVEQAGVARVPNRIATREGPDHQRRLADGVSLSERYGERMLRRGPSRDRGFAERTIRRRRGPPADVCFGRRNAR